MAQEGGLESYMNNYLMFFSTFCVVFCLFTFFFQNIFFEICHEACSMANDMHHGKASGSRVILSYMNYYLMFINFFCCFSDMLAAARNLKDEISDSHVGRCVGYCLKIYQTEKLIKDFLDAGPPSNLNRANSTIISGLFKINKMVT